MGVELKSDLFGRFYCFSQNVNEMKRKKLLKKRRNF